MEILNFNLKDIENWRGSHIKFEKDKGINETWKCESMLKRGDPTVLPKGSNTY